MNKNALFEKVFDAYVGYNHSTDISTEEILESALKVAKHLSEKYGEPVEEPMMSDSRKDTGPSLDEIAEGGKAIMDVLFPAKSKGLTFTEIEKELHSMDCDVFAHSLKKLEDLGFMDVKRGDSPETTVFKLRFML